MIETYLLEHLNTFKKYNTLSETAEHLHLTQPTLTRSMAKLEDAFGVPLFIREKKRLYLNENGKLAAKYAENILTLQDQMLRQVRALDRVAHTIQIGSCAPGPLMEITPVLSRGFSGKTIATEVCPVDELLQGLGEDKYQFIILPYPTEDDDTKSFPCGSEKLNVALVPSHRLAHRKRLSFKDFDGESFLMNSNVGIWDDIVRTEMPNSRFLLQSDLDALLEVAVTSVLPSFSTDLTIRILGERGDRVSIPLTDKSAKVEYYCHYRADKEKQLKPVVDMLKNQFR